MRRVVSIIAAGIAIGCIGFGPARAETGTIVPLLAPPMEVQSAPAPAVEEFGWQVVVADALGIVTSMTLATVTDSRAGLLPYLAAAPAVHLSHGDATGALASVLLHAAAPLAGGYIGYEIDARDCAPSEWLCDAPGLALGVAAGLGIAMGVDAVWLARVERPATVATSAKRSVRATPSLAVDPDGRVALGLAGRF